MEYHTRDSTRYFHWCKYYLSSEDNELKFFYEIKKTLKLLSIIIPSIIIYNVLFEILLSALWTEIICIKPSVIILKRRLYENKIVYYRIPRRKSTYIYIFA